MVPRGSGSVEQAEGHQAELQKLREGAQGPGAGATEDFHCGKADPGLEVGDWGMERTQHPQVAKRPWSRLGCQLGELRAFTGSGRIQEGQDSKDLKEGFGQGSLVRFV